MQGNPIGTFLPLILLVVVFYFLLIRPQRKRQQEQLRMQSSLTPGTRVMTTTGLFGTVVAVEDDEMVLEVAPGVETRWLKAAVGRVVVPGDAPVDAEPVDAEPVDDEPVDGGEDGLRDATADDGDSSSKKS
ncbi:preprotein translocase subunit YajC [Thermopolyspora sp. NPDC052614]|uniref:preprotein translocase subunit YajC n=1 Tax=Thermopolyspora sp. NPDC052614 TaxID=3155682 RepID=UPI0034245BE1